MGIGNRDDLKIFLDFATKTVPCGGRSTILTLDLKLQVIEYWKSHSQISIDHRNNRHEVYRSLKMIKKVAKYLQQYDDNITLVDTKSPMHTASSTHH